MDVALAMIMEPITPKKVKTIMNHRRPQKSAACEMGGPSTTVRIVIDVESQIPLVDPPRACPIAGVSLTALEAFANLFCVWRDWVNLCRGGTQN